MSALHPVTGDVFRHYKGTYYEVLLLGTHTETKEPLVVYRRWGESDSEVWVRPLAMFMERLCGVPRFEFVTSE